MKVIKPLKSRNQGFYKNVCLFMMEGSGSAQNNYGSGSRRPKNVLIRRIRIWIRNTGFYTTIWLGFQLPKKKIGTLRFELTMSSMTNKGKVHFYKDSRDKYRRNVRQDLMRFPNANIEERYGTIFMYTSVVVWCCNVVVCKRGGTLIVIKRFPRQR